MKDYNRELEDQALSSMIEDHLSTYDGVTILGQGHLDNVKHGLEQSKHPEICGKKVESESSVVTVPSNTPSLETQQSCVAEPLVTLIEKNKDRKPIPRLWSGVKKGSFGFVFGPSKSGKTIFCENLGMFLSFGFESFLGEPLIQDGFKVLFISLEEYIEPRLERNIKQYNRMREKIKSEHINNYQVVNEQMPRYITTDEDYDMLGKLITDNSPDIVIIDSLTRLYMGSIEESKVAKDVTTRLSELTNESNITLIVIHHTPKQKDESLSIESLAGSRVLAQEADFLIGINKLSNGTRYIKEVACRYKQENEEVLSFKITDNLLIKPLETCEELDLLNTVNRNYDPTNRIMILKYISSKSESGKEVTTHELLEEFVTSGKMGRQTLFDSLKTLQAKQKIKSTRKGYYTIA